MDLLDDKYKVRRGHHAQEKRQCPTLDCSFASGPPARQI
jgi:hypothetical protein